MTPVFFNGYGEWFVIDCFGNSHRISELGGYFRMPEGDKKYCVRWELIDAFRKYYDRLGPEHVAGDFRLTDDDERKYLERKEFLLKSGFSLGSNELEFVDYLLPLFPVADMDCEFTRFARKHGISVNDYSRCYFKIAKQEISDDSHQKELGFMLYEFQLPDFGANNASERNRNHGSTSQLIVKPTPVTRNTEFQEVIRAAMDILESKNGKTPTGTETAGFMLSGEFQHSCIASRTDRQLRLISGNTLDKTKIERIYRRSIYPHPAKADIKSQ